MAVRFPTPDRERQLRAELRRILARIVDAETERVILFGSTARGEVKSTSDLDLLVVRRDARPPAARVDDLYRRARPTLAVDLLVYTAEELEVARRASSFIRAVLRDGELVHDGVRPLA